MTAIYKCVLRTRLACSLRLPVDFLYAKVRWNSRRRRSHVIFPATPISQADFHFLRRAEHGTPGLHRLLWGPRSPDHRDLGFRVAENDPASAATRPETRARFLLLCGRSLSSSLLPRLVGSSAPPRPRCAMRDAP